MIHGVSKGRHNQPICSRVKNVFYSAYAASHDDGFTP